MRRSSRIAARLRSMCGGPDIILATADGCGTAEIMRRSGKSKPVVWRWQARFMAEGVEGLTRDKTRKPGKPPLPDRHRAESGRPGTRAAAGRNNSLDRPDAGESRRGEPAFGATYSRSPPTRAASHSLRNGFTAYAVLSPATNSSCHRRRELWRSEPGWARLRLRQLDTSNGCQDHRFCRTQPAPFVCTPFDRSRETRPATTIARRRCRVHRIPSRVRDDRDTPLLPGKDGASW